MPGILEFCRLQIRKLWSRVLSRAHSVHASRILCCHVVVEEQAEVLLASPPVWVVPAVLVLQRPFYSSKFYIVPRASPVLRRLHRTPGGFLRTYLHFSKPIFGPTRCSCDKASRTHQQPLIVRELGCPHFVVGDQTKIDSPNTHKAVAYGAPDRYWNGVLPLGLTVKLVGTNPE